MRLSRHLSSASLPQMFHCRCRDRGRSSEAYFTPRARELCRRSRGQRVFARRRPRDGPLVAVSHRSCAICAQPAGARIRGRSWMQGVSVSGRAARGRLTLTQRGSRPRRACVHASGRAARAARARTPFTLDALAPSAPSISVHSSRQRATAAVLQPRVRGRPSRPHAPPPEVHLFSALPVSDQRCANGAAVKILPMC